MMMMIHRNCIHWCTQATGPLNYSTLLTHAPSQSRASHAPPAPSATICTVVFVCLNFLAETLLSYNSLSSAKVLFLCSGTKKYTRTRPIMAKHAKK